jgi:hypothetical protein
MDGQPVASAGSRRSGVNFSFTCPHCGVMTHIDSSLLGTTVPFPEKVEATETFIGADEVSEISASDAHVLRADLQGDESRRYEPSKFWGIPIVIVGLIMSGRAALQVFAPRARPLNRYAVDELELERDKFMRQLQKNNSKIQNEKFKSKRLTEAEFQELKAKGRSYPVESSESILPVPQ